VCCRNRQGDFAVFDRFLILQSKIFGDLCADSRRGEPPAALHRAQERGLAAVPRDPRERPAELAAGSAAALIKYAARIRLPRQRSNQRPDAEVYMAKYGGIGDSLRVRRRKAAEMSLRFFLLGAVGTLGAVVAAWGPAEMGLAVILSEALGFFGFLRFGWWLSHLRAIDQALAGEGRSLVEDRSHDLDLFAFRSKEA
jgi:hypothetical protein